MGTNIMRTFFGTILSHNEIRLENSLTIKHNTKGFTLGSKVLISFDMCKNRIKKIWCKEKITSNSTETWNEPEPLDYIPDPELDDEYNRLITILEGEQT